MNKQTYLVRTNLYASAAKPARMGYAAFCEADGVVYDLEDSVPDAEKDAARFLVYQTLKTHRPQGKYISIRVNGSDTPFFAQDLEAAVRCRPDAIRIPKAESAEQIRDIAEHVAQVERKCGMEEGAIDFWCLIESHKGVLCAREIAGAHPRVRALVLGAEDFTASIGAQRTKQGHELFLARGMVLLACREAGIYAIDVVFSDINDPEGLLEDAKRGREMGFDGKTVIHPGQIEIVNRAFTPDEKEIRYAQRVVAAAEEGRMRHQGAVSLDGKMLDKPVELRARALLERARLAGAYGEEEAET